MNADTNPRAVIGGNQPPSPFDEISTRIADLYDEAAQYLDGEPISTQGQADDIGALTNMIRAAEKDADALRVSERAPFDDQIASIQARYAPLIGNTTKIKGKTVLALEACKKALEPWLKRLDDERRAVAEAARKEAEEKAKAAAQAMRDSSLSARAEAEKLLAEAKQAERAASRAANSTATAKGGAGRAIGLRIHYLASLTDANAFARYVWTNRNDELREFLAGLAQQLVNAGQRSLPGVTVTEERRAV